MNDEQWRETIGRIQDTFKVLDHEVVRGDEVTGDTERIEFETPQGKMKLERVSKPRVVGKSALGSKRIGGSVSVRYQYSDTEKVHTMKAYRWDEQSGDWKEIVMSGEAPAKPDQASPDRSGLPGSRRGSAGKGEGSHG